MAATHHVSNQPPPLVDVDLFSTNTPLVEGLQREGASWALDQCVDVGRSWGTAEVIDWGRLANEFPPKLKTHDRFGNRIDEVEFHPAWHELMTLASSQGLHALPWTSPRSGAHTARAAMGMVTGQVEAGHGCPMTMTFAAVPALRAAPDVAEEWVPLLIAAGYDGELKPISEKT